MRQTMIHAVGRRKVQRAVVASAIALVGGALAVQGWPRSVSSAEPDAPPVELPPVKLGQPPEVPMPPADDRRLPLLGGPFASVPKPDAKVDEHFGKYVDRLVDPQKVLDLVVGRNRLLVLKEAPKRVQLGDSKIATSDIFTPMEITLTGKKAGTTVLTIWFADKDHPGKETLLSYLVRVFPDPEQRERTDRVYAALADEINRAFPNSAVKLQLVGDKLVLSGHAKDVQEAYQILRIARSNAPQGTRADTIPVGQLNLNVPPEAFAAEGTEPTLANFLTAGGPNVINQLRIDGEQQVMLRVSVAEVNRSAARSIGININAVAGEWSFASLTGTLANVMNPAGNLIQYQGNKISAALNALKTLNLARSLAEPNITALNGRTASFLAGGSFPVPVVTGATAVGLQGVQFIPFGVSLQFTPVITDRDRIRLNLLASVSDRDNNVAPTNINGASISSLTQRTFQTTVELREGQTLAIAGLIQANLGADSQRIPFFSDIPLAGRLFASDHTETGDQELVVLVTPELVRPIEKGEMLPMPGDEIIPASDWRFYVCGDLVSPAALPTPAEIALNGAPPLPPAARKSAIEQKLLVGPSGYSEPK